MPQSNSILIGGRTVSYSIRQTGRTRRAGLRVTAEGLCVTLPRAASLGRVEPLIRAHEDWVLKHLDQLEERRRDTRLVVDGAPAILYRGEAVALRRDRSLKRVMLENGVITVSPSLADPAQALEQWLREECRAALAAPVAAAEGKTGRRHTSLTIRDQKTRWGSCSAGGGLNFNWRLIQAPPAVLDYVACHEVAHLSVPNHSPAFWALVADICPHWETSRRWLRDNQHRLMAPLDPLFEPIQ
jgi:predicted metal-dependent hydrolase